MNQSKMLSCASLSLCVLSLVACSTNSIEGKKIDYKSAKQVSPLELPPDLSRLNQENRYTLPKTAEGVSLTDFQKNAQNPATTAKSGVLIDAKDVTLERAGTQRWLVINKTPEEVWDVTKEFWLENGFILKTERPEIGVMETDWAENRANIPSDFIRETIGKIFDSLYSTSERDKFRTRIEKNADGKTEVYVSHRGMQEVYTSNKQEQTIWQPRAADPELEAEFLRRLVLKFGAPEQQAKNIVKPGKAAEPLPEKASLQKNDGRVQSLLIKESFDRSWRRVGLALDQVGFTVEDRDRSKGVFFVRYVNPEDDNSTPGNKKGFLSRMFSSKDKTISAVQYQIKVQGQGEQASVQVFTKDGQPEVGSVSEKILVLLHNQLK